VLNKHLQREHERDPGEGRRAKSADEEGVGRDHDGQRDNVQDIRRASLNRVGPIASSRRRRVRAAFAACPGAGAAVGLLYKVVVVMTPSSSRPRSVTVNGV